MKSKILPMLIVGGVILIGMVLMIDKLEEGERTDAAYATRAEAVTAGEFKRGWIPEFVPKSATRIRVAYDLDSNSTSLRFHSDNRDRRWISGQAVRISGEEFGRVRPARLQPAWWPVKLGDRWTFYRCHPSGRFVRTLAIDWRAGEACFWAD